MLIIILLLLILSLLINGYVLWRLLPTKTTRTGAVVLDTSALMDGRILEIVKSGFVPATLIIPRFVIAELQLLADKADHTKRERARYGLQIVQDLQDTKYVEVRISGDNVKSEAGVDEKLVKLALKQKYLLLTTDFNLLKVAEIEGVRVLNINQLAQNLRSAHIPGEHTELKIVAKGQEKTQGVGYLEDGTMVVVEKAGALQGKKLKIEVTRSLQTAAGRMMFARIIDHPKPNEQTYRSPKEQPVREQRKPNQKRRVSQKESDEERLIATINSK